MMSQYNKNNCMISVRVLILKSGNTIGSLSLTFGMHLLQKNDVLI